jgi:hypothetical protein
MSRRNTRSTFRSSFGTSYTPLEPAVPPPIYAPLPRRSVEQRSSVAETGPTGTQLPTHYILQPVQALPRGSILNDDSTQSSPTIVGDVLSNLITLARLHVDPRSNPVEAAQPGTSYDRNDKCEYPECQGFDPDDPQITGALPNKRIAQEDIEANCREQMRLSKMSYKDRRTEAMKIKIEYNITCAYYFCYLMTIGSNKTVTQRCLTVVLSLLH